MVEVLIALGSNVGDSVANLREATEQIAKRMRLLSASSLYQTAPMYVVDQADFLNGALAVETDESPLSVLATLKRLELQVGREVRWRNGPREIDLDLIAYGRLSYAYAEGEVIRLKVPHPRVAERRFVLQPLADVAPDFELPGLGLVRNLLAQTDDQRESVKKVEHELLPVQRLK